MSNTKPYRLEIVTESDHPLLKKIAAFEENLIRNRGDENGDTLQIKNGDDYLGYYKLLGEPYVAIAITENDEYICSGLTVKQYYKGQVIWFIDDVKIAPQFKGVYSPGILFEYGRTHLVKDDPYYALVVNTTSKTSQLIMRFYRMFGFAKTISYGTLNHYSLPSNEFEKVFDLIVLYRGPITGMLSLKGKREYYINGQYQNDYYVQFGPFAIESSYQHVQDAMYNFFVPQDDSLDLALQQRGVHPSMSFSLIGWDLPFAMNEILSQGM